MEASITLKKVGKLFEEKTVLAGLNFGVEKVHWWQLLVKIILENLPF